MREKIIEHKLVKAARERGGLAWKFTSPGTSGVPDRIVLLRDGKVGFVEVKAPGKKTRPIQERRMRELRQLGFYAAVIDGVEQIGGVLDAIQAT